MKIIRWLFSHIILVLLIVVVIYGYMFWGRLADSDTPGGKAIAYLSNKFAPADEADEQDTVADLNAGEVSRKHPADSAAKDGETSMSRQQSKAAVNETPSTIEGSSIRPGAARISKDASVSSDVVEQFDSLDEDDVAVDVNNTSWLTDRQSKTASVSPAVADRLNNVGESVAASQSHTKMKATDVKVSWITARTSYYQRNYALSEQSYQRVIDNTEDNYDAYGELGNVYFNQGKNTQAASAYYEAAAIFVRMGQRSRAESLIDLLWRLDPSKADELQQLIDSASS